MNLGDRAVFGSHGNDLLAANALIWAAVIVAVPRTVDGSGFGGELISLLAAAGLGSLLVLGAFVRHVLRSAND